jgi:exocyst complex component 1
LKRISEQIFREEAFIADFLQITDNIITYADYMDLDSYFRRVASRNIAKGMRPATVKLQRSALDLIFGFLGKEIKDWVDGALQREPMCALLTLLYVNISLTMADNRYSQVFGITAACERQLQEAEARNATFLASILQRQLQRLQALLDRYIVCAGSDLTRNDVELLTALEQADQIKTIEATKLTVKKRTGVAYFIKHFPVGRLYVSAGESADSFLLVALQSFADHVEAQLVDYDQLGVRRTANAAYEGIVSAMFETLQQMAKLERGDASAMEDKGQLNYFIIMIGES